MLEWTGLFKENEDEQEKPVLDFSKIANPEVRKYMEAKYAKEQDLAAAKDKRDIGAYGDIAGRFLEGINQPTNIRYENSFKNLGSTPKRSVGDSFKYDDGGAKDLIEKGVKEAEAGVAKTKQDYNDNVQMENYSRQEADYAQDTDPTSEVSKQYQELAKEFMPGKDFSQVSAKKLKEIMPPLEKLYQHRNKPKQPGQETWTSTGMVDEEGYLILNNKFTGENKKGAKVGKKPGADKGEAAPKPMNEGEMQRFDNVRMGMTALDDAEKALNDGEWTFSLIGDNKYTQAATAFEEALGRMQSGGAIQKDEAVRFRGMLPTSRDSEAIQKYKLKKLKTEFAARLDTLKVSGKAVPDIKPAGETAKRKATTFDQLPD
jgi:hypothetical protein